ncbi:MAG: LysM peptidoglycan-binding domain-containing protein, partial [Trueperaceae bacterium]
MAISLATGLAQTDSVTVQPGDSLWSIAVRLDTTVDDLMAANGLSDASLHPGDVLIRPGSVPRH